MNHLEATITNIENSGSLHMVEFQIRKEHIYMLSLELPNVEIGMRVRLAIKPLNIGIAKRFSGSFSFSNKLFATIKDINIGEILCSIKLNFNNQEIESVISKKAIVNMHLKTGDTVVLFIKASDVSIKEFI